MNKKSAFSYFAPYIKEFIYRKGWTSLNKVQEEAARAILNTDSDIIIASGTATGKTEAALFPVLTDLYKNPSKTMSVLYIGPLKALINDQFRRLSELLEESDLPLWPWHGDISQKTKERAKEVKKGIIQITPESLEALLIKHPDLIKELFSDLRYIIVDEIHSLMGADRGLQVMSQIERIERLSHNRPRRIGLSATLGSYDQASFFISSGDPDRVIALGLNSGPINLGLRVESFLSPNNEDNPEPFEYLDYLYERTRTNKSLIFTNSRSNAEVIISNLKDKALIEKTDDIYHIHHGSLSKELRNETERALKKSDGPITTAATLTLELGIDIGDLDQTIQLGAPFTVSNFVQRLGRSGRVTGKPLMRFINFYDTDDFIYPEDLPWELLRSIAIIELYLKEKWIEPFNIKSKPYSLLIHQTLSILTSCNELKPNELARQVLTLFPFKDRISQEEYKEILRELIKKDFIQQLPDGSLIIGLTGEKIVNHYTFYAVFSDSEDYIVKHKGKEIGSLSEAPEINQKFSLGGKSWQVIAVNEAKKTVEVIPSFNSQAPSWSGSGIDIDSRVIEKIGEVLDSKESYAYLSEEADKVISKVREFALGSGILSGFVIEEKYNQIYLFPWCGTRETRTLAEILKNTYRGSLGIKNVYATHYYILLELNISTRLFLERLSNIDLTLISSEEIKKNLRNYTPDKFDLLLPEDLLKESYLKNYLNLDEARKILKNLSDQAHKLLLSQPYEYQSFFKIY